MPEEVLGTSMSEFWCSRLDAKKIDSFPSSSSSNCGTRCSTWNMKVRLGGMLGLRRKGSPEAALCGYASGVQWAMFHVKHRHLIETCATFDHG